MSMDPKLTALNFLVDLSIILVLFVFEKAFSVLSFRWTLRIKSALPALVVVRNVKIAFMVIMSGKSWSR